NAGHLDVLPHHLPVRPDAQGLISVQQFAEILPAPGGGKLEAVCRVLDAVEVVLLDVQVGEDGPVEVLPAGVLLPHAVVLLHVDALHPVQGHHVEVPDGLVVLRRVARRHDQPPLGKGLVAESLALEELEHHGGQGLADAVDLVQEEDALLQSGPLHQPVNGGEDLAHGVLGDGDLLPAISPLFDEGQADGALSGVVGDGVGHQAHAGLGGDLLHDLGLAHARRAHQQHRPLAHCGDQVVPQ
ncbi:Stage 0 sporulation A-like protein, partial [Dysosmobacter welbionis]